MTSNLVSVWRARNVLGFLIRRDLAVKYQQSVLGYLWSLIEPLMMGAIYYFVFEVVFNRQIGLPGDAPDYIVYLLSGIFAYMWVGSVLGEATHSLTGQAKLITTMKVPREVFPIGRVFARFAEFAAGLPILFLAAISFGGEFGWQLLSIPLAVLLQVVFLVGIALFLSSINVMLRDIERFMRLVQRMLFYGSPIIYPITKITDNVPEWGQIIYKANPLVGIYELHHSAWYPELFPSPTLLTVSASGCVITLLGGWWVFRRLEPAVLKEL